MIKTEKRLKRHKVPFRRPAGDPQAGVSLLEVLVAAGILVIVLVGLFRLFIYCQELADLGRNMTLAVAEAQGKMEEIRNHPYADITADYASGGTPGNTFNLTQVNGKGVITIDASNNKLLGIKVVVCWQNHNGRVIGDDKDLDGVVDAGDANGVIDSLVTIESRIAQM